MKQIYLLIIILFTTGFSNAQDEQLLGQWFLNSINIDGVQHDNYIGEISLNFTDIETPNNSGYYTAEGGTPCEFHATPYSITSENTVEFLGLVQSASCGGDVDAVYTTKYIKVITHDFSYSDDLSFNIIQEDQEMQLTLTNINGDSAVYKTYPPTATLFKTWYSYSTETANGVIYPSPNDTTTFTISKSGDDFTGYNIDGNGGCNEFNAVHYLYATNENEFFISFIDQTLVVCEDNVYEPTYFSVLSDEVNATFSYELLDNGDTLVLTNSIGDILTFGSNPLATELLGEWYLNHVEVDDVIHPNYYNNESLFELEFIESPGNEGVYDIIGTGACDSFGGTTMPNQNYITFTDLNFTLFGPCPPTPGVLFESIYYSIYDSGQTIPFDFPYTIVGENENQILTITNSMTGDKAVYGKTPNTEILTRTWYLSRIEIPGNPTIQIPLGASPFLTLMNDINPNTFRTTAFGEGECNAFMSDYEITLNNGNSIQLLDFSPTLAFCESGYENEYFSIIGFSTNNFSEFEIINNGSTLILTDLLGARLVFGDDPLSISDNELNPLQIALKNNPVTSEINLSISQPISKLNYQIYSIEGKLVKEALLVDESINVEALNSGLYFIRFYSNTNQVQILKFIKQ